MARTNRRELLGRIAIFLMVLSGIWLLPVMALAPKVPGGVWTLVLVALLATPLPIYLLVQLRATRWYPGKWTRLLLLRPFWYVQLCVLLLPVGALLGGVVGVLAGLLDTGSIGAGYVADGARTGMLLILLLFAVTALLGYVDSRRLRVVVTKARFADLPAGLNGLRIVQLSDLHVGPHSSTSFMQKAARLVREARPDLIAVTGDLVDDFDRDTDVYARFFGDLAAPLGVWVVPGNHDVYADWPKVRERLTRLPQRVLVNEWALLEHNSAKFALIGTGDPAGNPWGPDTASPRLDDAVKGIPGGVFTIALAHNPSLWPGLAKRGVRLTLSGHTHWGQFALPWLGWSLAGVFLEHAMGAYRNGNSMLYVNPGTNYWGVPFRLGAPPEVGVVVLHGAEQ